MENDLVMKIEIDDLPPAASSDSLSEPDFPAECKPDYESYTIKTILSQPIIVMEEKTKSPTWTSPAGSQNFMPCNACAMCAVCGDKATGKHYNVHSCEGCKGFFKRAIRMKRGFICIGSKNCPMTKELRNRCQYCRLKKCIEKGMRQSKVQQARPQLKLSNLTTNTIEVSTSSPLASMINRACEAAFSPERTTTTTRLKTVDAIFETKKELQPRSLLLKGGETNLIPDECIEFTFKIPDAPQHNSMHFVNEVASRLLFQSINWIRSLPAFQMLSFEIQVSVIKSAWSDIFVLGLAQCQNILSLTDITSALLDHLHSQEFSQNQARIASITDHASKLRWMIGNFLRFNMDDFEFAAAKVFVVFSPDRFSQFSPLTCKNAARIQTVVLAELENRASFPKSSVAKDIPRDQELLLLLYQLRGLSSTLMCDLFFGHVLETPFDEIIPNILNLPSDSFVFTSLRIDVDEESTDCSEAS